MPYNQKGTLNSQLLLEEQRFWTTHLAPQLLSFPPAGWALQSPRPESQWGMHPWVPPDYSKQGLSSPRVQECTQECNSVAIHLGWAQRDQKKHSFPVCPWKGFNCILSWLLPEDLACNQLESSCWLWLSPWGHQWALACSQSGVTEKKDDSLNNVTV